MTITKKVGFLLLLLTVGSLIGTITFARFLQRTSVDFLFFLAANNEERMLQQLEVNAVMIRDGHEDVRAPQRQLIADFDALLGALEHGGENPSGWSPVEVTSRVREAGAKPGETLESSGPEIVRLLTIGMPVPPPDLQSVATDIRAQWSRLKDSLLLIAERSKDDPDAAAAADIVNNSKSSVAAASRQLAAAAGTRLLDLRQVMLWTLLSIASLSVILLGAGLVLTRRFIARPVRALGTAAQRIGAGDFAYRVPEDLRASRDELADLGVAFNTMAGQVQRYLGRYLELFENASDFVYTADLNGRFLTVNRAAETILGYSREELLQKTFADLSSPGSSLIGKSNGAGKTNGKDEIAAGVREIQVLTKDGKSVSLEDNVRPIYENGSLVGVQGVARDVTERNRLREQLDLGHRMEAVGRLAGGIAHDFGNVLTIIEGYCMLIRNSLKKDDPLQEELEGIRKASRRATSMIRHLLTFSRGQIVSRKILNVELALREMTDVIRRLIGENIELTTKIPHGLGYIQMDPAQLEQVLLNLALNSRDSMPEGGKLYIEAENAPETDGGARESAGRPSNHYIRLKMVDTGRGMSPEVLSRIFEPFFSTKVGGTGLGLSSVYSIVREAGGRILAESQPGAGTTMTVFLPRKAADFGAEELSISGQAPSGRESILLVEDEVEVRRSVREMLRSQGYRVMEANDQVHALSLCGKSDQQIDLVLTDVVMPNMSGAELAVRLKALRPDVPILFMSGYPRDEFEKSLKRGETVHFIQKPVSAEELAGKVQEALKTQRI